MNRDRVAIGTTRPYVPPHMRRDEALALGVIACHGRSIPLPGETSRVATLVPVSPLRAREPVRALPILSMSWSGGRFELYGDPTVVDAFVLGQFGASIAVHATPPLRALAFEYWLGELLEQHGLAVRGAPEFHSPIQTSLPFRYRWHIRVAASDAASEAAGELHCNATGHFLLAGLLGRRDLPREPSDALQLPVRQRLVVGSTCLGRRALHRLRRHDVLIVREKYWRDGELLLHAGPTLAWRARLEGSNLIVTRGFHSIMTHATSSDHDALPYGEPAGQPPAQPSEHPHDPEHASPADEALLETEAAALHRDTGAAASLDDIPVVIQFDLGEHTMTFASLHALVPGSVMELGRTPGRAVSIRANGALVGHGELVEIDGLLGVAVTELRWSGVKP